MIKLIGKIKERGSVKILNIYNKNIAGEILKAQNKISIKNYENGILIQPNGKFHATIAQNRRIQVAITNIIKKGIINCNNIANKILFVYINPADWGIKEIVSKCTHMSPLSKEIPINLMSKRAAIRLNNKKYYLDISSKRLYELAKKQGIKCLFNTNSEEIVIIKSSLPEARKLTPHSKKRIQIAIPKEILSKKQIESIANKRWLPVTVKFNLDSFGLKVFDFYSVTEEKELVKYLSSKGIKIAIKDYREPFDIKLLNKNIAVEVHNSIPAKEDFASRHRIKIGQVRLRILEAYHLIKNKQMDTFFLIINQSWRSNRYISELLDSTNNRVRILYTDFKDSWCDEVGDRIIKVIDK